MNINVTIKGLDKINKNLKSVIEDIPNMVAVDYKKEIVKNLKSSKKTGALSKSFNIEKRRDAAAIISKLPYANIQNQGGKIRITDSMRKKMWALYKQYGLGVYKAIALTKKRFITIPAKHYTEVNERSLIKGVNRKVNKRLNKI